MAVNDPKHVMIHDGYQHQTYCDSCGAQVPVDDTRMLGSGPAWKAHLAHHMMIIDQMDNPPAGQ